MRMLGTMAREPNLKKVHVCNPLPLLYPLPPTIKYPRYYIIVLRVCDIPGVGAGGVEYEGEGITAKSEVSEQCRVAPTQ